MSGDERVADDDVLRAGTPQAERVPRVVDFDLRFRHDHVEAAIRRRRQVVGQRADEQPVAMVDAGAELPTTGEPPASFDCGGLTLRGQRPWDSHVRATAEDLILALFGEAAENPRVPA